jgi:hypothetical protein
VGKMQESRTNMVEIFTPFITRRVKESIIQKESIITSGLKKEHNRSEVQLCP